MPFHLLIPYQSFERSDTKLMLLAVCTGTFHTLLMWLDNLSNITVLVTLGIDTAD